VTLTRSGFFRRYPEGEESAVFQVKAEAHGLIRQRRQIFNTSPANRLQRFVCGHRRAILHREARHNFARLVQNFDTQFALRIVHVDEQMLSGETHWPCREHPTGLIGVHRSEAVASERGQSRGQGARLVVAWAPATSADVKVEFITDDEESATGRLDIVRVPITLLVGDRTEGAPIRAGPVPSVPAVPEHNIIWLVTVRG